MITIDKISACALKDCSEGNTPSQSILGKATGVVASQTCRRTSIRSYDLLRSGIAHRTCAARGLTYSMMRVTDFAPTSFHTSRLN
jgi:hypothetical protein